MTIEQSINWCNDLIYKTDEFLQSCSEEFAIKLTRQKQCVEIALAALHEKAERDTPQPLTLDELRQMDGQPVFIASGLNLWGVVIVDNSGRWSGIPFVKGRYFNYNADTRAINCYRYPPKEAH